MKTEEFNSPNQDLSIEQDQVHIWNIDLDKINSHKLMLRKFLSHDELTKASRFHFEIDKERFICGKGLLRLLISAYTTILPNDITYCFNNFGKPELSKEQNMSDINFNLSHSQNHIAFGFTKNSPIGIDIEFFKPIPNFLELAQNYFSELEYLELSALTENKLTESFYTCWTSKETVVKFLGEGLSFPLKKFNVKTIVPKIGKTYSYELKSDQLPDNIKIEVFRTHSNCVGAFAVNKSVENTLYCLTEDGVDSLFETTKKIISKKDPD